MGSALFCFGSSGKRQGASWYAGRAVTGVKARAGVFPEMGQWRRGDWALQLRSGEKMPSEVKRMRNGDMLRFLWTDGQK